MDWKGDANVVYRVRRIMGYEKDGSAILAKRSKTLNWPVELRIGGHYYLEKNKLYRVEELLRDHRVEDVDGLPRRPAASSQ